MKKVHMHIDRLTLHGFRHQDRHDIAEGIKQQLTEVFSAPDSAERLATLGDLSLMEIYRIKIGREIKPQQIGARVAREISKGITK